MFFGFPHLKQIIENMENRVLEPIEQRIIEAVGRYEDAKMRRADESLLRILLNHIEYLRKIKKVYFMCNNSKNDLSQI
jgi:hypothetical protein